MRMTVFGKARILIKAQNWNESRHAAVRVDKVTDICSCMVCVESFGYHMNCYNADDDIRDSPYSYQGDELKPIA